VQCKRGLFHHASQVFLLQQLEPKVVGIRAEMVRLLQQQWQLHQAKYYKFVLAVQEHAPEQVLMVVGTEVMQVQQQIVDAVEVVLLIFELHLTH
jgi:hypothetical protein